MTSYKNSFTSRSKDKFSEIAPVLNKHTNSNYLSPINPSYSRVSKLNKITFGIKSVEDDEYFNNENVFLTQKSAKKNINFDTLKVKFRSYNTSNNTNYIGLKRK